MRIRWPRVYRGAWLIVLQVMWFAPDVLGAGVMYRFRPGSPELSSSHVVENVEIGPFLDPRELVARGPAGWGFSPPFAAEFEGVASTMRSDGIGPVNQPLGPRLTIEAWFRALASGGETSLLTNRVAAGDGFLLGLADGIPFFELVSNTRRIRVSGLESVGTGEDHWLAATVSYDGSGTLTVALYLDGQLLALSESEGVTAFTSPYVISAPFYLGTRAEGSPLSPTLVGTFEGLMYAAVVRDYVARDSYLSSHVPFDGSEYFGLPSYHDYPLGQFHLPMDQRIANEPVEVRHRFFLPYANDEFIPQGTASRVEGSGENALELVYVAYHHRTREGTLGILRSIVTEIYAATGRVRRTFRLRGQLAYSHAGGVAFSHDALFISSVGFLERYPLPPYEGPNGPKYIDLPPDPSGSISVPSKASFVSAFEDTLWVGDWRPSNDVAPFLYSHRLMSDGRPESSPSHVFALPRNVQGVDLFRHNGETYVFLSRNRSSTEAEVLRYRRHLFDRNVVAAPDTTVTMPHGIEDLSFFPNGTLWTNSESGTVYYQRRDNNPWPVFYPFVYSVPAEVVVPGAISIGTEAGPGRSALDVQTYPNPLRDSANITITLPEPSFVHIYVADLLGRRRVALWSGRLDSGRKAVRWDAAGVAPGVYFAVVESSRGRWVQPMVVAR